MAGMPLATQTSFDSDGDNTAQQVKATPGVVHAVQVANINAADAFLQLFDALAANVTVGTTVPKLSFLVPAGDGALYGSYDIVLPQGIKFSTAITYACTTTPTGNSDPAVGLTVNILYV